MGHSKTPVINQTYHGWNETPSIHSVGYPEEKPDFSSKPGFFQNKLFGQKLGFQEDPSFYFPHYFLTTTSEKKTFLLTG